MWNPFGKKKSSESDGHNAADETSISSKAVSDGDSVVAKPQWDPFGGNVKKVKKKKLAVDPENLTADMPNMGFLQRMAMKKIMAMSPEKREELIKKVMTPKNIAKNKEKIIESLDTMLASGKLTREQYDETKRRMGLL